MKNVFRPKVLLPLLLFVVALGVGGYVLLKNDTPVKTTPTGVRLTPATKQERADSEQKKQQIVDDQQAAEQNQPAAGSKKDVTVVITNANSSTVNAYVSGIFEDGGICTATFSGAGTTRTKQSNAFQNASNTQCAPMELEDGFLKPGTWKVSVAYASAAAAGASNPQTFEVK